MVIFSWEPKLELGIELLDRQHRELIKAINAFFISYKCRDDIQKVSECLDFLNHYTLYLFQAEEAFQVRYDYPLYRDHQAKHNYLGTQLKFHSTALEASRFAPEKMDDFHKYLQTWICLLYTSADRRNGCRRISRAGDALSVRHSQRGAPLPERLTKQHTGRAVELSLIHI